MNKRVHARAAKNVRSPGSFSRQVIAQSIAGRSNRPVGESHYSGLQAKVLGASNIDSIDSFSEFTKRKGRLEQMVREHEIIDKGRKLSSIHSDIAKKMIDRTEPMPEPQYIVLKNEFSQYFVHGVNYLRHPCDLTMKQVSHECGISEVSLRGYMAGGNAIPKSVRVMRAKSAQLNSVIKNQVTNSRQRLQNGINAIGIAVENRNALRSVQTWIETEKRVLDFVDV